MGTRRTTGLRGSRSRGSQEHDAEVVSVLVAHNLLVELLGCFRLSQRRGPQPGAGRSLSESVPGTPGTVWRKFPLRVPGPWPSGEARA